MQQQEVEMDLSARGVMPVINFAIIAKREMRKTTLSYKDGVSLFVLPKEI